jgi:hypothetical protein
MLKKKINKARLKEQLKLGGMALGLAIIVWMIAKAGETREAKLTIPIQVTSVGPQVEVQVVPPEIPVIIRYGREASPYISSENFTFVVDASNMQEDLGVSWKSMTLSLSDKNWVANIPSARVDLAKIGLQGSTVEISMRYNAVPAVIKPEIVGLDRLPDGYQLVSPVKSSPREVYLVGDPDRLSKLPVDDITSRVVLKTAPISVAGRTGSSLENVEILLPAGVNMVQRSSNLVEVNLEIQEVQTVREIDDIPLNFQAVAPDTVTMVYTTRSTSVRVFGPQSLLRQLSPESFRVSLVRPQEEVPGTVRDVPLEVHFTSSISEEIRSRVLIQAIEPNSIRVEYVAREKSASSTTSTLTTTATEEVR